MNSRVGSGKFAILPINRRHLTKQTSRSHSYSLCLSVPKLLPKDTHLKFCIWRRPTCIYYFLHLSFLCFADVFLVLIHDLGLLFSISLRWSLQSVVTHSPHSRLTCSRLSGHIQPSIINLGTNGAAKGHELSQLYHCLHSCIPQRRVV